MLAEWQKTRKTFRHGRLAKALIEAAVARLEKDGVDALSLRELAKDVGVNHRAVYRRLQVRSHPPYPHFYTVAC